ncbi:MAG: translation elongation factor 4, partial [Terriglobia bacterium]
YRGVIVYVRVVGGEVKQGVKVRMMATGIETEVEEVGFFRPDLAKAGALAAGEVGYLITGIKNTEDIKIGDTVTSITKPIAEPLPGYKEAKPMVFCGMYPIDGGEYESLRKAFEKLKLNDPSFTYDPEKSLALGFGFRVGFLGLLHMEIVKERLEREFGLNLLITDPTVPYEITKNDGEVRLSRSPLDFPESHEISALKEPFVDAVVLTPPAYLGQIFELLEEHEGDFKEMNYLSQERVKMEYRLPLREILWGFYSHLKGRTRGYGSIDYEFSGYEDSDLVKLEILLAGQPVDALSTIVPKSKAYGRARRLVERLRKVIPRQLYEVPIQARIGGRIIARETVKPLRKDVTAKLYGGDVTRKRKLLEKQKAGKRRMKKMGNVEIPQEAFLSLMRIDEK